MTGMTASLLTLTMAAGCGVPSASPEDWTEPPARPGSVELVGHWTTATHAGNRGVSAHPVNGIEEAPAFCIAYLDGRVRDVDSCVVSDRPFEWERDETYPWTIRALWEGLGAWDDETVARLAVHAFDDQGRPVARWTGAMDEHAGHVTE